MNETVNLSDELENFKYSIPARGQSLNLATSQPLYNIEFELSKLLEDITEAEGEMTPEQEIQHKNLIDSFNKKGESYGYIINNIKGDIDKLDGEIDRLSKRKVSYLNQLKRIDYVLIPAIQRWGTKKITPTGIVKYILKFPTITFEVATKEVFNIENIDLVPNEYRRYKVEITNEQYEKLLASDIKFSLKTTDALKSTVEEEYDKLFKRQVELADILNIPKDNQLNIFTEQSAKDSYNEEYIDVTSKLERLEASISIKNVTTLKTK